MLGDKLLALQVAPPAQRTPAWVFAMCATIHTNVTAIYQTYDLVERKYSGAT